MEFLMTGSGSMPPYLVKLAWVAFGLGLGLIGLGLGLGYHPFRG